MPNFILLSITIYELNQDERIVFIILGSEECEIWIFSFLDARNNFRCIFWWWSWV